MQYQLDMHAREATRDSLQYTKCHQLAMVHDRLPSPS